MKYEKYTAHPPSPAATGGEIALDIECINLVEQPDLDFQTPDHWSVFAVPIGHRAGTGTIETDVLFRRGPSMCDELALLEAVAEWIRNRNPDRLVTYNGSNYDFPILRHRARVSSHECPGSHALDMGLILDSIEHTDLFYDVAEENEGEFMSLDDALDQHCIHAKEVRLDGEPVTGADMPGHGQRILAGDATKDEIQAVKAYGESDVEPLFTLADSLTNE